MRSLTLTVIAGTLALAACSKADSQADALDNAADQADPAAATVMRNAADEIRENGTDANLSAPGSPVQDAMSNAGMAAVNGPEPASNAAASTPPVPNRQAEPHRAGDPVPAPKTR